MKIVFSRLDRVILLSSYPLILLSAQKLILLKDLVARRKRMQNPSENEDITSAVTVDTIEATTSTTKAPEIPEITENGEITNETTTETTPNQPYLTRSDIQSLGKLVQKTDSDDNGLELFCYLNCSPEDNDLLKKCRGVVFHGDDIVLKAFPYTTEYDALHLYKNSEKCDEIITSEELQASRVFIAHEGALLRVFYYGDKWYISTHRKLSAFRSKWASQESFGETFQKALDGIFIDKVIKSDAEGGTASISYLLSTLDESKQYMFLVCNTPENRIVCTPPPTPTVYHVGTFVNDTLVFDEDVGIPYPKEIPVPADLKTLCEFVEGSIDYKNRQGVIVFAPGNKQFKIFQSDYMSLFLARGNEPSIKYRYLQVRMNPVEVDKLCYLYPDHVETFKEYENNLYDIAKKIHNAYIDRFIKKQYTTVPKEEFGVVRACHSWYFENRQSRRVNREMVIYFLNNQTPTSLNRMIRRLKSERKRELLEKEGGPSVSPLVVNRKSWAGVATKGDETPQTSEEQTES